MSGNNKKKTVVSVPKRKNIDITSQKSSQTIQNRDVASSTSFQNKIGSNWDTRNNSSNVSASLHPKEYSTNASTNNSSPSSVENDTKKIMLVSDTVQKKKLAPKYHCSNCYCQEDPVPPRLNLKPNWDFDNKYFRKRRKCCNCYRLHEFDVISEATSLGSPTSANSNATLEKARNLIDYSPESVFLKRIRHRTYKNCPCHFQQKRHPVACVKYATPRQVYEDFRKTPSFESQYIKELQEYEQQQRGGEAKDRERDESDLGDAKNLSKHKQIEPELKKQSKIELKTKDDQKELPNQLLASKQVGSGNVSSTDSSTKGARAKASKTHAGQPTESSTTTSKSLDSKSDPSSTKTNDESRKRQAENLQKIKDLNAFRQENYFDTHSTADLLNKKIPDHKCIHKFTINKRLMPEPVNFDEFGVSRCIICNEPMKSEPDIGNRLRYFNFVRRSTSPHAVGKSKKTQCNLPKKFNIDGVHEMIELTLPLGFCRDFSDGCMIRFNTTTPMKVKKPVPTNSLALRYQRRVV